MSPRIPPSASRSGRGARLAPAACATPVDLSTPPPAGQTPAGSPPPPHADRARPDPTDPGMTGVRPPTPTSQPAPDRHAAGRGHPPRAHGRRPVRPSPTPGPPAQPAPPGYQPVLHRTPSCPPSPATRDERGAAPATGRRTTQDADGHELAHPPPSPRRTRATSSGHQPPPFQHGRADGPLLASTSRSTGSTRRAHSMSASRPSGDAVTGGFPHQPTGDVITGVVTIEPTGTTTGGLPLLRPTGRAGGLTNQPKPSGGNTAGAPPRAHSWSAPIPTGGSTDHQSLRLTNTGWRQPSNTDRSAAWPTPLTLNSQPTFHTSSGAGRTPVRGPRTRKRPAAQSAPFWYTTIIAVLVMLTRTAANQIQPTCRQPQPCPVAEARWKPVCPPPQGAPPSNEGRAAPPPSTVFKTVCSQTRKSQRWLPEPRGT